MKCVVGIQIIKLVFGIRIIIIYTIQPFGNFFNSKRRNDERFLSQNMSDLISPDILYFVIEM